MGSRVMKKPINTVLALSVLASGASLRAHACEGEIALPEAFVREAEAVVRPDTGPRRAAQARAVAVRGNGRSVTEIRIGSAGTDRDGDVIREAGPTGSVASRAIFLVTEPPR